MWNKEQVNPPGARYGASENLDTLVGALKKLSLTFPVACMYSHDYICCKNADRIVVSHHSISSSKS